MSNRDQVITATVATPVLPVGEDLLLRPLDPGDAPALEPMLNDPLTREMFRLPLESSITAGDWIAGQLALPDLNAITTKHFAWAIVLQRPGMVIGCVELVNISFHEGGELQVFLDPAHRGCGYGTLALNAVIRWAFEELVPTFTIARGKWNGHHLPKVTALVLPHNMASIQMLRKTPLRITECFSRRARNATARRSKPAASPCCGPTTLDVCTKRPYSSGQLK
jgi:RimJ/RimL family protein N-acetyltransferase